MFVTQNYSRHSRERHTHDKLFEVNQSQALDGNWNLIIFTLHGVEKPFIAFGPKRFYWLLNLKIKIFKHKCDSNEAVCCNLFLIHLRHSPPRFLSLTSFRLRFPPLTPFRNTREHSSSFFVDFDLSTFASLRIFRTWVVGRLWDFRSSLI